MSEIRLRKVFKTTPFAIYLKKQTLVAFGQCHRRYLGPLQGIGRRLEPPRPRQWTADHELVAPHRTVAGGIAQEDTVLRGIVGQDIGVQGTGAQGIGERGTVHGQGSLVRDSGAVLGIVGGNRAEGMHGGGMPDGDTVAGARGAHGEDSAVLGEAAHEVGRVAGVGVGDSSDPYHRREGLYTDRHWPYGKSPGCTELAVEGQRRSWTGH